MAAGAALAVGLVTTVGAGGAAAGSPDVKAGSVPSQYLGSVPRPAPAT